ncbi:MAG: RIP metalloprotease RseP [Lactobacillus delbrueckii]|nr:RIP metalloprotease RseP [Lactobacillus delbrueckii]MCI1706724.1 RIP metalloprotease RseP [Lactobacillus delbrueckii]MCI1789864.1 RIP metalloprotease RseP [Lactobacillus delbrueckii]
MKSILAFIIVFGLVVFVHEFGHFFVAKKAGILVREFSIGMGPKLVQWRPGQTTYTIRWLPLGGYVRLASPDEQSEIDPGTAVVLELNEAGIVTRIDASESDLPIEGRPLRVTKADLVDDLTIAGYENGDESQLVTYKVDHDATMIDDTGTELQIAPRDVQLPAAKPWKKLATSFAGPFMNVVLGFVALMIYSFASVGPATTTVGQVAANSPAQHVLQKGDQIVAINGRKISTFDQVSQAIDSSKGKTLTVKVKRQGSEKSVQLTPKYSKKTKSYLVGIVAKADNSFSAKLKRGWDLSWQVTGMIFQALGNLFKHFSLNKLSGPVGIYSETSKATSMGLIYMLAFVGMLSINLGIVNLIPIPGLDGGKLLLELIELLRGKPIPEEHETVVDLIGVVFLLILIIAVTGNDIYRYFIK